MCKFITTYIMSVSLLFNTPKTTLANVSLYLLVADSVLHLDDSFTAYVAGNSGLLWK